MLTLLTLGLADVKSLMMLIYHQWVSFLGNIEEQCIAAHVYSIGIFNLKLRCVDNILMFLNDYLWISISISSETSTIKNKGTEFYFSLLLRCYY